MLPGTAPRYIRYQLARPLGPRSGTIQVRHQPEMTSIMRRKEVVQFTQEDVDEGRVIYYPPKFRRKREIHLKFKGQS